MTPVFVDTNVWIDAFRNRRKGTATALSLLLDEDRVALAFPTKIELLMAARKSDAAQLERVLSALPVFLPTPPVLARIEQMVAHARNARERFGFTDLLIASTCIEHEGLLWSEDRDFSRMVGVCSLSLFKH